eukprot:293184_1
MSTNIYMTSPHVESYRNQLNELNTLLETAKLFKDIDIMLKAYQSLKREYTQEWSKYETYETKIKTFLRFKNPENRSISISMQEIQTFITKIRKIQFSLTEWLNDLTNLNDNNSHSLSAQNSDSNIRQSHLKKNTSESSTQMSNSVEIENSDNSTISDELNDIESVAIFGTSQKTMRSFGALFSKQFHIQIANNYKQSVGCNGVFQPKRFFLINNEQKTEELMEDIKNKNKFENNKPTTKQMKVVQFFHDNYYGQNEIFESAFGARPVIYCDWTASGKPLECVERYLESEMYTLYANTHTTTSITGIQTSKFRAEARSIILESLSGDVNQDVVIFAGSGVTGAIYKISRILMQSIGKSYKPETSVVFISIYEHNSNIFIWKELGCKIIIIPEDNKYGGLDLNYLEKKLKIYTSSHMKHKYNLLIGSFSAASNVSGIIAPVDECTLLLKRYNCLSFWDYATAGPYMNVNMTNKQNHMLSKDAIFISPHKYLGGPGSPGILCAKKKLFLNHTPVVPGGGTVFIAYGVNDGQWEYLDNIEEREEGGTPDIIGSVRAAFVFMIKDHLSTHYIEETEKKYLNYFLSQTKELNNLVIMGNTECERLPVLSFVITHSKNRGFGASTTKYLHFNFIAALFNDLFGIQGRGGCACAGMYGLHALGMNNDEVNHVLNQMRNNKNELARPGYYRINLHYTLSENELKYVVDAVKYICNNGWRFLPLYDIDKSTGNYFHRDIKRKPDLLKKQLRSLLDISFNDENGKMEWVQKHMRVEGKALRDNFDKFFILADEVLDNLEEYLPSKDEFISENEINDENAWYWLPSELYDDALKFKEDLAMC